MSFLRRREASPPIEPLSGISPVAGIGEVAICGSLETIPPIVEGLSHELTTFREEWATANETVSDYLEDDGNRQHLATAVDEYRYTRKESFDACPHRRILGEKLTERDLPAFVTAKLLETRATGLQSLAINANHETGGIRGYTHVALAATEIKAKWAYITDTTCPHTPQAATLYKSLEKLAAVTEPHYRKADKMAERIQKRLVDHISKGPNNAAEVLDSLEALADSDNPDHQTLLRILATDHIHNHGGNGISIVDYAINVLEAAAPQGGMVESFLREKSTSDPTHWIHYLQKTYEQNGKTDFAAYLEGDLASWPLGLQEEYEQFVKENISLLRVRTKRDLQRYVDKQLITPTLEEASMAVDRLLKKLGGTPVSKVSTKTKHDSRVSRGLHDSSRVLPLEHTINPERHKRRLAVASRVFGQQGADTFKLSEQQTINDMVDGVAADQQDTARYAGELKLMLRRIAEEPLGAGTTRLVEKNIRLGGKDLKVRRLNPNNATGLSLPLTHDCRVVFTITGDVVAILGILPNHKAYENFVKNL